MSQTETERKKEYLRRYQVLRRRERQVMEEIDEIRSRYTGRAITYSDMPKAKNATGDLSDYAAKVDLLLETLETHRREAVEAYQKIEAAIEQLPKVREREVLRLRYLQGLSWEMIAAQVGYSVIRVYQIHGNALINFKLPKDYSKL